MPAVHDTDRLALLERSGLLDRAVSERLTGIVTTATTLLRADLAEVNAVTATHQVHAARHPDPELLAWHAEPVADSACRLVVTTDAVVDIPDSSDHPVCSTQPWSRLYRGYLGAPIRWQGTVLGSLCVLTFPTRQWSAVDHINLTALADLVSAALD